MSCLSKEYRLNTQRDFSKLYKSGKSWHTPSFVAFFNLQTTTKIAFVASKKVGNAVARNLARRRMRAVLLTYDNKIKNGNYIFVAKSSIKDRNFIELKKDFDFAIKRLELLK
ncbi:ribonuclease P protein component [Aliarcobacter vitoriensis]|uniref:Ribonuclease P protein component n=1 Tax=Aliarcobacter vitoriensis TaxID=2011099 RepID=A0A366MVY9_9BACT|nr:ribonuclease P protein component [Aliarcobacter vitoriensis]RBQ29649.1 ribonuclease P protein component [Aliarcobacter vitoriensis]RBQ30629.1 ribonuclease P protein component [Arcobacter sp. FW59]